VFEVLRSAFAVVRRTEPSFKKRDRSPQVRLRLRIAGALIDYGVVRDDRRLIKERRCRYDREECTKRKDRQDKANGEHRAYPKERHGTCEIADEEGVRSLFVGRRGSRGRGL
jgi:hypothetical protein